MFGYKRITVARHERGLLFRNRSLERVLEAGVYRFIDPYNRVAVENYDLAEPELVRADAEVLVRTAPEVCGEKLQLVEVNERQVGLVYLDGNLTGLIPPATRKVYWRGPLEMRVEKLEIGDEIRIPARVADLLARSRMVTALARNATGGIYAQEIPARHVGLLYVDGELKESLKPGLHAFWSYHRSVRIELVDLRQQAIEVSGQEILTKDKVSLRLNLAAAFVAADPVRLREALENWKEALYRELQFGLRQAVGTRTLEKLLEEKESLGREIRDAVAAKVARHGLELQEVGVKDVILPGEMKQILNKVVEAEKAAQANVIRRREETAATRSLLNTAKMMDENPLLLRLKELESLEKVTERIDRITVFGGLEGVLGDLVKIGRDP
jgi:regulator of protease activity HflC (stomatin/prohibitin superfamily)